MDRKLAASVLFIASCWIVSACGKKNDGAPDVVSLAPPLTSTGNVAASTAPLNAPPAAPAGDPPADGKYERVIVEGKTVPMIQVMNGGTVVLVDTDGAKPRTWEEQYKKKRTDLLKGQFDIHKTNTDKDDSFDKDPIDKEGLWVIDAKGNITKF